MESIAALADYLTGFFDWIYTFITETSIEYAKDFVEWLLVKSTVSYIEFKIWSLEMAWGVASSVLDVVDIGSVVSSYSSSLDSSIGYVASAIGLFDAMNMIIQSMISSFVLKFLRF